MICQKIPKYLKLFQKINNNKRENKEDKAAKVLV